MPYELAQQPSSRSLLKALASRLLPEDLYRSLARWRRDMKRSLRNSYALRQNGRYDARRYLAWSSTIAAVPSQAQLHAILTKDYHRIEKGLALPAPRPGFGADVIRRLTRNLEDYRDRFGADETVETCLNALSEYLAFNRRHEFDLPWVERFLMLQREAINAATAHGEGGTRPVTRAEVHAAARWDLTDFFASRYSVRQFADKPVALDLIETAIRLAQKTPSVCNRQSGRVHVFSDEQQKAKVLSFQNGNRGFGQQAGQVLIVTADLRTFTSVGERNQAWIDGGMFAMSLVYALHSLGLGTCTLNWSVEKETDSDLHQGAGIPDHEVVIMMIAVGHLPESFRVAQSPRRPLDEVMVVRE